MHIGGLLAEHVFLSKAKTRNKHFSSMPNTLLALVVLVSFPSTK
jgi:hypothetical protein